MSGGIKSSAQADRLLALEDLVVSQVAEIIRLNEQCDRWMTRAHAFRDAADASDAEATLFAQSLGRLFGLIEK